MIQCLECGRYFDRSMAGHAWSAHGLHRDAYCRKHNLPLDSRLCDEEYRQVHRDYAILSNRVKNLKPFWGKQKPETLEKAKEARLNRRPSKRMRDTAKKTAKAILAPYSVERSHQKRTRPCERCGGVFYRPREFGHKNQGLRRKYCVYCYRHRTKALKCEQCGKTYHRSGILARISAKYCSHECRLIATKSPEYWTSWGRHIRDKAVKKASQAWSRKHREDRTCSQCGKQYSTRLFRPQKFCSTACYNKSKVGKAFYRAPTPTHCPRGHEYTEDNKVGNGKNSFRCKRCNNARLRKRA